MKKIMTGVLLWTALAGTAFPQNTGDFEVDARGVITRYNGFDTNVVIPAEIGGNVALGVGNFASFDNDFDRLYNNGGKAAGTYTYDAAGNWAK